MLDRTNSDLDVGDTVMVFGNRATILDIRMVEGREGEMEPVAICQTEHGQVFGYSEELYLLSKGW